MKHFVLNKLVLIGASTGGPGQIEKIVSSLPPLVNTSIIIAQHMVKGFIPSFAARLEEHTINKVSLAINKNIFETGQIYLCSGFTEIKRSEYNLCFSNKPANDNSFNPDINTIFNSCIPLLKEIKILSIILTGIGDDGVKSCKELNLNGARCIAESKHSAIVDGMPCRARKEIPNIEIDDIDGIITKIKEFCN
ncbi:MAG: CheB methylesterase domain-containing protein [Sulfurimonas sp.]|nr:CheB methylesterase domain-containing protein [Sulfurimonas sp.]